MPKPYPPEFRDDVAPSPDDLVKRDLTAASPKLWLSDLTEHRTAEGKVYLCANKDVWSNRIVG